MMLAYVAPFLAVSALVLCAGSVYYIIEDLLRSRPPKRIEYTTINRIDFNYRDMNLDGRKFSS